MFIKEKLFTFLFEYEWNCEMIDEKNFENEKRNWKFINFAKIRKYFALKIVVFHFIEQNEKKFEKTYILCAQRSNTYNLYNRC